LGEQVREALGVTYVEFLEVEELSWVVEGIVDRKGPLTEFVQAHSDDLRETHPRVFWVREQRSICQ
jgi:hypothetical protein